MTCVLLNAIPRDWADPGGWPDTALRQCEAQPWTLLVLHDLPTGAMDRLPAFIERLRDRGAAFRQDFPPQCVPLRRGEIVGDVQAYTAA